MRNPIIPATFYAHNRERFGDKMKPNSISILTSNDLMPTNADDAMGFAQNNDLFYLSGIDQEETILLLYPDAYKKENREILFLKETNELIKIWEGDKLTKEEAMTLSGIKNIKWLDEFEKTLQLFAFEADNFYLGHNEHIKRLTADMLTQQDRMIDFCKKKYPLHSYERAAKITRGLRQIKTKEEVELIKKANEISAKGFLRALKAIKPGIYEYEIEAELSYELFKGGGIRHAFKPIIASGKNACALHYNTNNDRCEGGEMILMDFGTCYGNYNSDTTRCVPVNGKFSPRQREVYEAVLFCMEEGAKMLKPGVVHADYEKNMGNLVEAQLINLGLLDAEEVKRQDPDKPLFKKYFMHGTAHHIGLDVHDVGLYSRHIEAGMVFTCEPGIYIPEEAIGCRLENDYLVTPEGPVNLSDSMPIQIDEIEALMR